MEEKFCYLVTVDFYNLEQKEDTECILFYASDYKDLFDQIYNFYQDDLINVNIKSKDCYAPFTFDPKHLPYIEALLDEKTY